MVEVDALWSRRNEHAKNLITRMLKKNPEERISAEEALNSQWLATDWGEDDEGKEVRREI